MNWEAIGAIAEALGAIGVISTVVYIALQIRHNSEAVQGSTEQALMSQEMAFYALTIENAGIWGRGRDSMNGQRVRRVEVDLDLPPDIDTPEDYRKLLANWRAPDSAAPPNRGA